MRVIPSGPRMPMPQSAVTFQGVTRQLDQARRREQLEQLRLYDTLYGEKNYYAFGERFSAKDVVAYVAEQNDGWGILKPLALALGGAVRADALFEMFGDRGRLTQDLVSMNKAGLIQVRYSYSDVIRVLDGKHGYTIWSDTPVYVTGWGRQWLDNQAPADQA